MNAGETKKHPRLARIANLGQDLARPMQPMEQWQCVQEWYEYLEAERGGERPVVDALNEAWDSLEPLYQCEGVPCVKRGAASSASENPLSSLFYYIEMGFYPPPELMLALADAWSVYRAGCGAVTLEEAFLGRSVQKAGNYAKRDQAKLKKMRIRWEFAALLRNGRSRQEAAEEISNLFHGRPDADSILRDLRGFTGFKPKSKVDAEN